MSKSSHSHVHTAHTPEIEQAEREIREGNRKIDEAIDQFARGVEDRFDSARASINEPLTNARHLMDRADTTINTIKDRVQEGISDAEELLDRADVIVNRMMDPIRFIEENPRTGLAIAFLAGMFFGRASRTIGSRASSLGSAFESVGTGTDVGSSSEDLVHGTSAGQMPDPDEVSRRVEHANDIVEEEVVEPQDAPLNYDFDPAIRRKAG